MPDPDRKLRVLMVGPDPADYPGGISSIARYYFASDLVKRVDLRYVPSVRNGNRAFKLVAGVGALPWFALEASSWKPDVVHIHTSNYASFYRKSAFIYMALGLHRPVLLHVHAPRFHTFAEGKAWDRILVRQTLDRVDRILVLSEGWRVKVHGYTANRQVHVLYNPTLLSACPRDPVQRGQDEPCRLLFLGRLGERKGLEVLKTALLTLMPRFPHLEVTFAGDGEVDQTRRWADGFGWGDRVRTTGWIPWERKWEVLNQAHILTLPSYDEGLPLSVLEGMAAGAAIVTTPVGGIPEAVRHGQEGFLVAPGDADALADHIGRLVEDPRLTWEMGMAGRRTVAERFDIVPHVDALCRHYEEMAGAEGDRGLAQ